MISNSFDQIINREVLSAGITAAQGATLNYLVHLEECGTPAPCQHDIETKFNITHPTATGILRRLAEKNFVEFRQDEKDRRYIHLKLKESADIILNEAFKINDTFIEHITKDIPKEKQDIAREVLEQVLSNVIKEAKNM